VRLPIRLRLTVWYVLLLAVAIAALGAFVVVRLRTDLTADFDRSLQSAAAQIRSGYERHGSVELRSLGETVLRVLPADSGAQLIAADGRLVRASGRDLPRAPLLTAAQRRAVLAGHDVTLTTHGRSDTEPFRVHATAVTHRSAHEVLVVASSLEGVDAAVRRTRTLILIAGPALLIAIATGGWWLARSALRPVARLTEQAERIELDRLDERVPVPPTSDEIARLAVTLNGMLDRLERGVEDKRRLVADASHELRTPLAVMRSELDVALAYDDLQSEAARVLDSMRQEIDRMTRTVENLLTLARVDEGRLELLRRAFELREVIDDVAAELGPLAADKDVTIASGGDAAVVTADRERIRQVVANLVENAVKYSHAGGEVRVAIWHVSDEVGVSVADGGVGIPADALPQVFDRFYRAERARVRGGSGLGLAICREIVAAHGGRMWAESETGRGSRFSLALPLTASRPRA
jgi:heavy metal sensor kinase